MVMDQLFKYGTKCLFILVERNTYSNNINFSFPAKYFEDYHKHMVGIGLYLYN